MQTNNERTIIATKPNKNIKKTKNKNQTTKKQKTKIKQQKNINKKGQTLQPKQTSLHIMA